MKLDMFISTLSRIFDLLFPPRTDEINMRDFSDDQILEHTRPHMTNVCNPPAIALLSFSDDIVQALIHEAKYHHNNRAIKLLGLIVHEYLTEWYAEEGFSKAMLVPVPLSKIRHKARGYNQTEEIARHAIDTDIISIDSKCLLRTRDTISQTKLHRNERLQNMRDAFGVAHVLNKKYTYIIFDDVITTGATMQASIDALTKAGATRIIPLALAH